MNAFEGSASISDADGNGLFYCDGITVYDRSNNPMPNGSGLHGSTSSCQGVVIVPFPGDPLHYYLFTVPSQIGQTSEVDHMAYSVIDMSLHNGYGDVALKNIPLVQFPTEQLTATYHANGRDVWVLTRIFGTDQWYAYLITCAGLAAPVVSHAGLVVQDSNPNDTQAALGTMDVSYDGTRIASTWNDYPASTSYLELLDFDNATGIVSNGTFTFHYSTGGTNTAYSTCFSPGGQALYWSEFGFPSSRLSQFDLSMPDPFVTETAIATSVTLYGGLQVGRDGRMYMSRWDGSQYIARIDQPDVIGPGCGFVEDGVSIAPGWGSLTLSNDWMVPPVPIDPIDWRDSTTCAVPFTFGLTHSYGAPPPQLLWSTGASTDQITVNTSGTYSVMVIWPCDTLRDTVTVHLADPIDPELLPDSMALCAGEEVQVDAPQGYAQYLWSDGSTGTVAFIGSTGLFWLRVNDASGCAHSDTLLVLSGDCACDVFVPNVFSPNRDGINDRFLGTTTCVFEDYALSIFDRWGLEIWTTRDPHAGWNGGDAPEGVYVWMLRYRLAHGKDGTRTAEHGMVTLLR